MPLSSLKYLYFFSVVAITYYLIPYRYRWIFLLVTSCYFYASFSKTYLLLVLLLIIIVYLSAIAIEKASLPRKVVLFISILAQVGILCVFKYGRIIVEVLQPVGGEHSFWETYLFLPVGLSYIILQSIGYMVDVYNNREKAERNIFVLTLFFLFFPKITAGPIERTVNLIPQFRENHDFDYARVTNSLKLIAWGLFKKIIIADMLALIVDPVFDSPQYYPGISLLSAVAAFTLQIYFDFSGYSDIALGSAQAIGIHLTNNFRNPYFASSISEFWQRWHISLSSWLRDYIFFPLRRYLIKSRTNQVLSIIVASMLPMVVSGLWHGTGVTFVVWGLFHGIFVTVSPLASHLQKNSSNERPPQQQKILRLVNVFLTLLLVSFSWIFFRAKTLSDAFFIISNIFGTVKSIALNITLLGTPRNVLSQIMVQLPYVQVFLLPVFISIALGVEYLREKGDFLTNLSNKPLLLRWSLYVMTIAILVIFGGHGFSEQYQFIYFRF